jgi:hypothetical protein
VEKNELANEIVGFSDLMFFPLDFFNKKTIKCAIRFDGFMKI